MRGPDAGVCGNVPDRLGKAGKAVGKAVGKAGDHRSRLAFRRFLESGLLSSPRTEFGGGARAPFPNSGW